MVEIFVLKLRKVHFFFKEGMVFFLNNYIHLIKRKDHLEGLIVNLLLKISLS